MPPVVEQADFPGDKYIERKNFPLYFPAKIIFPRYEKRDSREFPGSPLGGNQGLVLAVISADSAEFAGNEVLLHGKSPFV